MLVRPRPLGACVEDGNVTQEARSDGAFQATMDAFSASSSHSGFGGGLQFVKDCPYPKMGNTSIHLTFLAEAVHQVVLQYLIWNSLAVLFGPNSFFFWIFSQIGRTGCIWILVLSPSPDSCHYFQCTLPWWWSFPPMGWLKRICLATVCYMSVRAE